MFNPTDTLATAFACVYSSAIVAGMNAEAERCAGIVRALLHNPRARYLLFDGRSLPEWLDCYSPILDVARGFNPTYWLDDDGAIMRDRGARPTAPTVH